MQTQSGNPMSRLAALAAMAALSSTAGCGSSPGTTAQAQPDLSVLPDLTPEYPPGPYGTAGESGIVLPDFTFAGYYSPTLTTGLASAQPYGDVTMKMLHQSGAKVAVIQLAAFW